VATVSPGLASKPVARGSRFGHHTGSYGLMIYASKSAQWFLGLGLKTKRAPVCQLRHKTDGRMKTAWATRRDRAACFALKQVRLGFPSLLQN
jgi:hypothetical protein